MNMHLHRMALVLLTVATLLHGCKTSSYTAYALTSTGSIISFDTTKPGSISSSAAVSGLSSGESLVQIGYRPADDTLYCLTSDKLLCTLDPGSGVATVVSSSAFTSDTLAGPTMSFDPVADELRVISTEYNLRVSAAGALLYTGTKVYFDGSDSGSGKTPELAAIAYRNPVAGATSTTLYALDVTTQSLLRVGDADVASTTSADNGDLHTVGGVGVAFTSNSGLAIEQAHGDAYASLQQSGAGAVLYSLDLDTGAATEVGTIGSGDQTIIALALAPD